MNRRPLILVLLSAMVFGAGPLLAAPVTVIDLGTLGGASSIGFGLNGNGLAVGWSQSSAGVTTAFRFTASGAMQPLSATADAGFAYGVNNAGTVAGVTYSGSTSHGTLWNVAGGASDLGPGTTATAINNGGTVAGGNGHAFLYSFGLFQDLGTLPGGNWSAAYAVNNNGVAAGYGNTANGSMQAFVWSFGTGMQALGTLGGRSSYASGINDAGQVVGHSAVALGYQHAFETSASGLVDLGTLGGSTSFATGINNGGEVVGYSDLAGNAGQHAFLYYGGTMYDLNSLIPAGTGWNLQQAYAVNGNGDIVGTGTLNGVSHAFLIDPIQIAAASVPEPGTFGLLAAGLAAGLAWKRRRT